MVKLKKAQNILRRDVRAGVVIDCDEISISVFPPPREHGAPHCHVQSKVARKISGFETYLELKVYLDGARVIEAAKEDA